MISIRVAFKDSYSRSRAFMLACPLLFLVPFAAEMAQHFAEMHIGMYDSLAAFKAAASSPLRMGFGVAKVFALMLPGYWIPRFLALGNEARAAGRLDAVAMRRFGVVLALNMVFALFGLFGSRALLAIGLAAKLGAAVTVSVAVGQAILGTYLTAWVVAAPLGKRKVSIGESISIIKGNFWWTLVVPVLCALPLMIVHYGFGYGAMGRASGLVWAMLTLDALLVSYLSAVMTVSLYIAATRAAEAKGVRLA